MLAAFAFVVAVSGLAIESVAVAGATWYPIRRRPPVRSLFQLQLLGFFGFTGGLILLAMGLKRGEWHKGTHRQRLLSVLKWNGQGPTDEKPKR